MTSHYTRGPVTTLLHGFWKCLGTLFVWALTIPWSQALGLTCEGGPNQIWSVCEGLFSEGSVLKIGTEVLDFAFS
jgi:hypothetical protein